jgi:hypothetical protein
MMVFGSTFGGGKRCCWLLLDTYYRCISWKVVFLASSGQSGRGKAGFETWRSLTRLALMEEKVVGSAKTAFLRLSHFG